MLSIILYGRNDNHGYNYHKRIAISINCLAEVLSSPQDEIIFVDYNSPNEFPTILEAIQDTLTTKAKSILRILRVRPDQHAKFSKLSPLPLLEPIARNIAIRRSNPANRWILSSNIDILIIPVDPEKSLSDLVSNLDDGFYCLPRGEIPENLWELALERMNPEHNLSFLREHSQTLHLNMVVRKEGFLKYDNPGDFQLMLRNDILSLQGFDERMLQGWHVDSNLSKRMFLFGKTGSSLEKTLKCYHCSHTYNESFLHSENRTQNDWHQFVDSESISPTLSQENWGLANEKIEEISLRTSKAFIHLNALQAGFSGAPTCEYDFLLHPKTYNQMHYSSLSTLTYLADHLCNLPPNAVIAYFGYNQHLVGRIHSYLKERNTPFKLLHCDGYPIYELGETANRAQILSQTSVYIFDFGIEETSLLGSKNNYIKIRKVLKKVMQDFCKVITLRKKILPLAKFIGVHVHHTDFNIVFSKHLSIRLNSYATGISYGYLKSKEKPLNWKGFRKTVKRKILISLAYLTIRYLYKYSNAIRKKMLKQFKHNT